MIKTDFKVGMHGYKQDLTSSFYIIRSILHIDNLLENAKNSQYHYQI